MVTIKRVAEVAGVSFKTVSRVFNDDPGVAEATRQRVLDAAAQLEYRPNFAARTMRTQQSHMIGLITDEIAITPYAVNIVKGAQDFAWANNKLLFVINTGADPVRDQVAVDTMLERRVEGIIYAATFHKSIVPPRALFKVPSVLLDCFTPERNLPSVVPDEFGGGQVGTELLIARGHRRIAFINFASDQVATVGRLQGYQAAIATHDIPFDPELIRYGNWRPDEAYTNTLAVMTLANPPTAIFCANDWSAMGTYDALRDLGLRIPDDVSVLGFDNEETITLYMRPPLSSIALPHYAMGQWAVSYLMEHDKDQPLDPVQYQVFCPPIERASIGEARNR